MTDPSRLTPGDRLRSAEIRRWIYAAVAVLEALSLGLALFLFSSFLGSGPATGENRLILDLLGALAWRNRSVFTVLGAIAVTVGVAAEVVRRSLRRRWREDLLV